MKKIFIIIVFILVSNLANAEIKAIIDGNKDAKIKLEVFESLTCSYCAKFHKEIYPKIKEDFIDKGLLSIHYRNFPLDMAALNASKIAHCKNNGESKMLHYLYENQSKWIRGNTIVDLNKYLKEVVNDSGLGLDFDKCVNNKKIEDHILEDRIDGVKKFEVKSTPTLIINGEKFENPLDYKKLKKYLEKLI